jgi:hypothetical protein
MTDAYVNQSFETFEFHDIALDFEVDDVAVYSFWYEGREYSATTVPNPTAEQLIDALLTEVKAWRLEG